MRSVTCLLLATLCVLALTAGSLPAAEMKQGTADLKSAGPLTFGPNGLMFVGDPQSAAIFAIDTGDKASQANGPVKIAKIDERMAGLLGTTSGDLTIADMAVNPTSGNVYFSVGRGRGPQATPVILRLDRKGDLTEFSLKDVKYSKAELPNPSTTARNPRDVLTGMAFVDGKLYVAGLSNEEFASKLRVIPFPFQKVDRGTSVEIYHGNHGALETRSPVKSFTTYDISGQSHLLAAYTCTPLVRIPVASLKAGEKIKGTTIAELGNRNNPLDMVVYNKGGKDYLLMSNDNRGVMKIDLATVGTQEGINSRVGGTAGLPYETVKDLTGVVQLSRLDKTHALIMVKEGTSHKLETIELP